MNPAKVPGKVTIRELGSASAIGEGKYGYNFYLARRGDAAIKTLDDLINKANFFNDPVVGGNKKPSLESANRATSVETAVRLQRRFAVQQIVLQCMAELKLDAIISPTSLSPARKLAAPNDSAGPGVGNYGMVALVGAQGFPAITVPAGFTTQVYDRVPDPSAPPVAATGSGRRGGGGGGDDGEGGGRGGRSAVPTCLSDPVPAKLPVGLDIFGRPFSEPTLLKIAAAYEKATKHRAPPARFGTVPGEATTGAQ